MNTKFQTKVNTHYDFDFDEKEILDADILEISESKFNLIKDHKSYNLEVLKKDFPNKYYWNYSKWIFKMACAWQFTSATIRIN